MDVILLERIEKLGQMGDVVKVKPGFARNYLLPQKKALRATADNQKRFESQRTQLEAANLKRRDEAQAVAKKLNGLSVLVIRQAGETGVLYGSVSARDISGAITEAGFTVQRSQVLLDIPIKSSGTYPVRVALHPEVVCNVIVNVARSQEDLDRASAEAAAAAAKAAPAEVVAEEAPVEAEEAPSETQS